MHIHLIANPVSGGDARRRIARAVDWLRAHDAVVELYLTEKRGDARRFAAAARDACDRVVVAGGDGTLNEVAGSLCGSALPVALLPLGTVNVFALETGIPRQLEPACRLALTGNPRPIHLASIDGERFLLMASAGWDAEAVARLRPTGKRWLGRLAYGVSAVEALLAAPPAPVHVATEDGSRHNGYGVIVSNARYYGGRYVVSPSASLDSPRLDVCLFKHGSRLAMLGYALRLGLHLPLRPPAVEHFTARTVAIDGTKVAVQVDGDPWGTLPVTITTDPATLAVVLPDRG